MSLGIRGRTVVMIVLSLTYLTFELAFNARLLDVVGSGAAPDEVHAIEVFGRSLSGIAVALMVLSWLWNRRAASGTATPGWFAIFVVCSMAAAITYVSLEAFVNHLASQRDPGFRRTSLNILLLQDALVDGKVQLDGLTEQPGLFSAPQGKAFLALFPAMAVSIDQLDEKIRSAKLTLIERKLRQEAGGIDRFHDRYQDAVDDIRRKYNDYRRLPAEAPDIDAEVARQQDKAWNDYLRDLGQRGWTPSSVPPAYTQRVVSQVRRKVPVPASWVPSDEAGFMAAVDGQVRRRLSRLPGADGVTINGRRVPPGLGWNAFFAHEAVQSELRRRMDLPAGTRLQSAYESAAIFDREVFRPLLARRAGIELRRYEAPLADFAPGGVHAVAGLDAARAVIVPPVALFSSLVGAALHLGKVFLLLFLLAHLLFRTRAVTERPRAVAWQGRALFAVVVVSSLAALRLMDNDITRSNLYGYMNSQLLAEPSPLRSAVSHGMHVIAVGQAYTYPLNESIRTRVLGGITYGYPEQRP